MEPGPGLAVLGDDPPNLCTIGIEFDDDGRPHDVERPDAQYEAGALLLRRHRRAVGHPARPRPRGRRTGSSTATRPARATSTSTGCSPSRRPSPMPTRTTAPRAGRTPRLVVMVPARNAAADLPRWFASVERFADAVVALDDGSTDDTAAIARRPPPRRASSCATRAATPTTGWDDGANRDRLLDAAARRPRRPTGSCPSTPTSASPPTTPRPCASFVDHRRAPRPRLRLRSASACGTTAATRVRAGCTGSSPPAPGRRFPTGAAALRSGAHRRSAARRHVRTSLRIQHWGSADEAGAGRRASRSTTQADPDGRVPDRLRRARRRARRRSCRGPRGPTTCPWSLDGARRHGLATRRTERPRARGAAAGPQRRGRPARLLRQRRTLRRRGRRARRRQHRRHRRHPRRPPPRAHRPAQPAPRHLRGLGRRRQPQPPARRRRRPASAPTGSSSLDADERIPADDADGPARLPRHRRAARARLRHAVLPHDRRPRALRPRRPLGVPAVRRTEPGQAFPEHPAALRARSRPTIPRDRWAADDHPDPAPRQPHGRARATGPLREVPRGRPRGSSSRPGYDHLLDAPADVLALRAAPGRVCRSCSAPIGDRRRRGDGFDPDAPGAVGDRHQPRRRGPHRAGGAIGRRAGVRRALRGDRRHQRRPTAPRPIVRGRFPDVRVVELDHPALPGEARNAGLRLARGDYVSFPGSHVELPPGSLAARIRAHDQGWTMVTGTTRNGTDTPAGLGGLLPRPLVGAARASVGAAVERAGALLLRRRRRCSPSAASPTTSGPARTPGSNDALFRAGYTAYRAADVPLVHHNRSRTVRAPGAPPLRAAAGPRCSSSGPGRRRAAAERAREFLVGLPDPAPGPHRPQRRSVGRRPAPPVPEGAAPRRASASSPRGSAGTSELRRPSRPSAP